jgi:hypothetical protein
MQLKRAIHIQIVHFLSAWSKIYPLPPFNDINWPQSLQWRNSNLEYFIFQMNTIHKQLVNLVVLKQTKYQPHKNALSSHKRNLHAVVTYYDTILQMQDFNLFSKIENNFQKICDIQNNQISICELL